MTNWSDFMDFIRIPLTKQCAAYLTAEEVYLLLIKDAELFKTAIQRGKAFNRSTTQKKRERAKFEEEGF